MEIIIETLLVAAVGIAITVGMGKLSVASLIYEPSWKAIGWISIVVVAILEILYWMLLQ